VRRACLMLFLALSALTLVTAAEPPRPPAGPTPLATSCAMCHAEMDGDLQDPVTRARDDIHFQKGLSCHDCHGGDPLAMDDMDAAHSRARGWKGKPARTAIPGLCARCHSDAVFMKRFDPHARVDQLSEYLTSRHGKRLSAGDDRVAVCVDCHGVHGIRAVSDPRSSVYPTNVADTCGRCHTNVDLMRSYGIAADQFGDYKKSVHAHALYDGGDLSAPTCNDCHGSHGAVPPGVDSVASICGSCHGREATLFRETEEKKKIDLSPCIRCMVCHGNHAVLRPTDDMLGVGPKSTCTGCHSEGEKEYVAAEQMGAAVQKLTLTLHEAHEILDRAERTGMEVSADRFALQKGREQLVETKVLAHSFDQERFMKAAQEGLDVAAAGIAAGHRAFSELRFRRVGLALSLLVIIAVIVALTLKVRQIEKRSVR